MHNKIATKEKTVIYVYLTCLLNHYFPELIDEAEQLDFRTALKKPV